MCKDKLFGIRCKWWCSPHPHQRQQHQSCPCMAGAFFFFGKVILFKNSTYDNVSCHNNTATSYVSHADDYAIHAHDDNTIMTPLQKWCVFFFGFCFRFVNTNWFLNTNCFNNNTKHDATSHASSCFILFFCFLIVFYSYMFAFFDVFSPFSFILFYCSIFAFFGCFLLLKTWII